MITQNMEAHTLVPTQTAISGSSSSKHIALYHRSLARFDSPPVDLQTPPTFLYFDASTLLDDPERALFWQEKTLAISQLLLGPKPEQAETLLLLLARLLHDYQSPQLQLEYLFRLAHIANSDWFTGLLLMIPIQAARSNECRWHLLEKDRVLDKDRFAYWCGESKRLRKLLRQQLELQRQKGLPDTTLPTLTERIDHLNSLMRREVRQVRELRAALPALPGGTTRVLSEEQDEKDQKNDLVG